MTWSLTKDKWLNSKIKDCVNFSAELESSACYNSVLTNDDRRLIKKHLDCIGKIINKRIK